MDFALANVGRTTQIGPLEGEVARISFQKIGMLQKTHFSKRNPHYEFPLVSQFAPDIELLGQSKQLYYSGKIVQNGIKNEK